MCFVYVNITVLIIKKIEKQSSADVGLQTFIISQQFTHRVCNEEHRNFDLTIQKSQTTLTRNVHFYINTPSNFCEMHYFKRLLRWVKFV